MGSTGLKRAALSVAILALAAKSALAAPTYNFINLGALGSDNQGAGLAINNAANTEVVGSSAPSNQAIYSTGAGPFSALGPSNAAPSGANAVNDGGIAAGYFQSGPTTLAFYSDTTAQNPVLTPLPTTITGDTHGASGSVAAGINGSSGAFGVVGQFTYNTPDANTSAFIWKKGDPNLTSLSISSSVNGLGDSSLAENSQATAINSAGLVVGQASVSINNGASSSLHGFIYNSVTGNTYDMEPTGADPDGTTTPTAINALGEIVGETDVVAGQQQAFIYSGYNFTVTSGSSVEGTFTSLGALDGSTSEAQAINAIGDVVGVSSADGGSANHAFIYAPGGSIEDLNDPSFVTLPAGDTLIAANGINDAGDITGTYQDATGNTYAFLLTPAAVPEPASLSFLGLLVGFGAMRRRRR